MGSRHRSSTDAQLAMGTHRRTEWEWWEEWESGVWQLQLIRTPTTVCIYTSLPSCHCHRPPSSLRVTLGRAATLPALPFLPGVSLFWMQGRSSQVGACRHNCSIAPTGFGWDEDSRRSCQAGAEAHGIRTMRARPTIATDLPHTTHGTLHQRSLSSSFARKRHHCSQLARPSLENLQ
ncbi:hypothetical protein BDZ45DRAFT_500489 [Acephala macrosclerotiorum]|nr:hypothetical protein BDZ45DRAFT_500489 [Acephala macrosclerotiorum]